MSGQRQSKPHLDNSQICAIPQSTDDQPLTASPTNGQFAQIAPEQARQVCKIAQKSSGYLSAQWSTTEALEVSEMSRHESGRLAVSRRLESYRFLRSATLAEMSLSRAPLSSSKPSGWRFPRRSLSFTTMCSICLGGNRGSGRLGGGTRMTP